VKNKIICIPQEVLTFRVLGKGGCEPGRDFGGNGQIRKKCQISRNYLKIRDKAKI